MWVWYVFILRCRSGILARLFVYSLVDGQIPKISEGDSMHSSTIDTATSTVATEFSAGVNQWTDDTQNAETAIAGGGAYSPFEISYTLLVALCYAYRKGF